MVLEVHSYQFKLWHGFIFWVFLLLLQPLLRVSDRFDISTLILKGHFYVLIDILGQLSDSIFIRVKWFLVFNIHIHGVIYWVFGVV